jgi:hypothetical protein
MDLGFIFGDELLDLTVRKTSRCAGTYIYKCTVKRLGQDGIIGYKWQKRRYIYFFDSECWWQKLRNPPG